MGLDGQDPWEESIRWYQLTMHTVLLALTHTQACAKPEGTSQMPNAPLAILDGQLTFHTRAVKRRKKKKKWNHGKGTGG